MTLFRKGAAAAALAASLLCAQTATHQVTQAMVDQWMKQLSNWNRWGAQDERGTLNLITPAKRKQAAALVRDGVSVSLSRTLDKGKAVDNDSPFSQKMTELGDRKEMPYAIDEYTVLYHGYAHSHIDSPGHLTYQGKLYNGFSRDAISKDGLGKLSVTQMKNGILTRGLLVDVPRLKNVPYLEPGAAIYPEDLDAWEKRTGIKAGSGDVLLIRTGRWARRDAKGAWDVSKTAAGLHASCAPWLKQRDVAVLGSDAASDVAPSQVAGVDQPIHRLVLVAMGMPILDNLDLEAVAKEAQQRNRWEFMLVVAPLAVPGGTGSPANPLAVF